jgi:5S rRNA maturation endonuclease (ribonuclease M5)
VDRARAALLAVRAVDGQELLEPFEAFVDLWGRILAEQNGGRTVVVVEGERDRRAVRSLGWAGPVVVVHRGHPISATAQGLVGSATKVIVLTDWDQEGGHLARRLHDFLGSGEVELDLEYRRRLARILHGELTHVEGLFGWARRQAERLGEPLERLLDGAEPAPTG